MVSLIRNGTKNVNNLAGKKKIWSILSFTVSFLIISALRITQKSQNERNSNIRKSLHLLIVCLVVTDLIGDELHARSSACEQSKAWFYFFHDMLLKFNQETKRRVHSTRTRLIEDCTSKHIHLIINFSSDSYGWTVDRARN